jgi:type II secretory ATPase GspE/PulE/Tfp pilus assembly ATPase PilB-like protein
MKITVQNRFLNKLVGASKQKEKEAETKVEAKPSTESQIEKPHLPGHFSDAKAAVEKELEQGAKLSVIRLIDSLVECGQTCRSSDIHIDPEGEQVRVRFRIDGVLQDFFALPKKLHDEVISRIKILAGLRTDEHQSSQDGRFRLSLENGLRVDVRVSIIPAYYGENAVLRLLSDKAEDYTLKSLGFSAENQKKILHAIRKPYGMILATGPTGSGKTTTLYTLVKMLNTKEVSIVTIEDPIEYSIEGINQIQANPRTDLTFANGLKSILRQDPNIIMVGEIRDMETAGIAVNTALTGHLLLSTLHTNDAATTLPRLLDMKVEPYLISSTVNIAIGQRLVRRICEHCKTAEKITPVEIKSLSEIIPAEAFNAHKVFYTGKGCDKCNKTGYQGRIGIHEVLVMDSNIREAILQKATASEIRKIAIGQGMVPMVQDGFEKAALGLTTIQEILRMLYE